MIKWNTNLFRIHRKTNERTNKRQHSPVRCDEHVPRHEYSDSVKEEDDVDKLVFVF